MKIKNINTLSISSLFDCLGFYNVDDNPVSLSPIMLLVRILTILLIIAVGALPLHRSPLQDVKNALEWHLSSCFYAYRIRHKKYTKFPVYMRYVTFEFTLWVFTYIINTIYNIYVPYRIYIVRWLNLCKRQDWVNWSRVRNGKLLDPWKYKSEYQGGDNNQRLYKTLNLERWIESGAKVVTSDNERPKNESYRGK